MCVFFFFFFFINIEIFGKTGGYARIREILHGRIWPDWGP